MNSNKTAPSNLILRVRSGGMLALALILFIYVGSGPTFIGTYALGDGLVWFPYVLIVLLGFVSYVSVHELCSMLHKKNFNPSELRATLIAFAFLAAVAIEVLMSISIPLWVILFIALIVAFFGSLFFDADYSDALMHQSLTAVTGILIGFSLSFHFKIFMISGDIPKTGGRLLLSYYLICWLGDIVAYFIGTRFGKHKIAPAASPGKTWEGALGNYLGNLAAGALAKVFLYPAFTWMDVMLLALFIGTFAQAGDLVESTWKRSTHTKDSDAGFSIPGHGGFLDRLDSLLFTAPLFYLYLHYGFGF